MDQPDIAARPRLISPSLFALSIFYGGMVCIAGVLGNKQVALGPLAVEAGIFAFLLLVVTSSAVAELHGPQVAGRLVRVGFVPLLVSLALSFIEKDMSGIHGLNERIPVKSLYDGRDYLYDLVRAYAY